MTAEVTAVWTQIANALENSSDYLIFSRVGGQATRPMQQPEQ
jgi:hypothetical protein